MLSNTTCQPSSATHFSSPLSITAQWIMVVLIFWQCLPFTKSMICLLFKQRRPDIWWLIRFCVTDVHSQISFAPETYTWRGHGALCQYYPGKPIVSARLISWTAEQLCGLSCDNTHLECGSVTYLHVYIWTRENNTSFGFGSTRGHALPLYSKLSLYFPAGDPAWWKHE